MTIFTCWIIWSQISGRIDETFRKAPIAACLTETFSSSINGATIRNNFFSIKASAASGLLPIIEILAHPHSLSSEEPIKVKIKKNPNYYITKSIELSFWLTWLKLGRYSLPNTFRWIHKFIFRCNGKICWIFS